MADNTESKVKEIIINELGVEPEKVTNDASFVEDLGADAADGGPGSVEAPVPFGERRVGDPAEAGVGGREGVHQP